MTRIITLMTVLITRRTMFTTLMTLLIALITLLVTRMTEAVPTGGHQHHEDVVQLILPRLQVLACWCACLLPYLLADAHA